MSASLAASAAPATSLRAWLFDAVGAVGALRASGWRIEASVGGRSAPMRVGPGELAELWGLSGAASEERAVDVVRSRRLPAPLAAAAPRLRPIGIDVGRSVLVPEICSPATLVLLGRTGSGKSTELVALAADDLRAGRGFTFIDPHGDAVARLLDSVPEDQAHRVHLLELAEKDHPRGFNPIELDGADPEIVAAQFVDTMRDLYFAHLSLAAPSPAPVPALGAADPAHQAAGDDGPWTLESLQPACSSIRSFRAEVLVDAPTRCSSAFWEHQWPKARRGVTDPSADALISKLSAFLSYPSIRAIVSAPRLDDPAAADHGRRRGAARRPVARGRRQRLAVRRPGHRPLLRRRPRPPGAAPSASACRTRCTSTRSRTSTPAPCAGSRPRVASSPCGW